MKWALVLAGGELSDIFVSASRLSLPSLAPSQLPQLNLHNLADEVGQRRRRKAVSGSHLGTLGLGQSQGKKAVRQVDEEDG